ncbi:MAG: GntR family transcriptional regulator [Lentisphaerae bacterium]|nr:GntR family transcriptional regulator [Lentisphaerota bacterium]
MLKYQKMRQILEELLNNMEPGMAFPPVRELMATYGVCQSTVLRAIGELEEAGLLQRKAKSGIFVSTPPKKRSVTALLLSYPMSRSSNDIIRGVQERLLESRRGLLLLTWAGIGFQKLEKILDDNQIGSAIIQPSSDDVDDVEFINFVQRLEKRGIRLVIADVAVPGCRASFVGEENSHPFREMTLEMLSSGVKSLTVAGKMGNRVYAKRLAGIRNALKKTDISLKQVDLSEYSTAEQKAAAILKSGGKGILLTDAGSSTAIAYELRLAIPEQDLSGYYIGGVVEPGESWPISGKGSAWLQKQSLEIGHQAVDMLQSQQSSPNIKLLPLIKGQ